VPAYAKDLLELMKNNYSIDLKDKDIRWEQRFRNYKKALSQLEKFIDKIILTDLEMQGLVKAFEYTYELAWNTMKDFLKYKGQSDIYGSRDAIKKAFQLDLINNGDNWMDMLKSRNMTSHTYNEEIAEEVCQAVKEKYYSLFKELEAKFESLM
jgi:nucleotidyltransferase substrate binding protein (TIGR01987 family)